MNIAPSNYNPNFCAGRNPKKIVGVSVRVAPQITRLTAIADLRIEPNKAIAYTRQGEVLSDNYKDIMQTLRDAVTELSWSHKYNTQRGTWCRR